MKNKNAKGEFVAIIGSLAVLVFSFAVMPSVLAAGPETSDIQTVTVNSEVLNEDKPTGNTQAADINAITKDQAIANAISALESLGYDVQDFGIQPVETRYLEENAPAGDPIWAVIFCDDQDGYAYAFGDEVNDEVREKIAAIGEVEKCVDENGVPGIRAHYSYTRYTLVEINALSGKYIRHGESIVELGKSLKIEETYWAPTTQEAWEQERQRQEQLEQELGQER